ncbi:MAG: isoaspartyl peptidase/L-asparaginase family protein [Flavobacteriaceae bacterium]
MKTRSYIRLLLCLWLPTISLFAQNTSDVPTAIVIHGGAGTILKKNMTPEKEKAIRKVLTAAVEAGHTLLKEGHSSQEAVVAAIRVMEDSPLFNAGKGAVLNHKGEVELDASFMDGKTHRAGAITGVQHVRNPIEAAIAVMEASPHVLLAGAGADAFAQEQGLAVVEQDYFITESRKKALKRVQLRQSQSSIPVEKSEDAFYKNQRYGTVGCVALDSEGNIAAGTSTGGMTNKKWNRIGDAPIIGAGTYASNESCGISATGWGEYFIRNVIAYDIAAQMVYGDKSIGEAAAFSIHKRLTSMGGTGGVIGLDAKGNVLMEMNTPGMYRAAIDTNGQLTVKIYADE